MFLLVNIVLRWLNDLKYKIRRQFQNQAAKVYLLIFGHGLNHEGNQINSQKQIIGRILNRLQLDIIENRDPQVLNDL